MNEAHGGRHVCELRTCLPGSHQRPVDLGNALDLNNISICMITLRCIFVVLVETKVCGNLVVAALQRHEALGWLGIEVKRDRLRGCLGLGRQRRRQRRGGHLVRM